MPRKQKQKTLLERLTEVRERLKEWAGQQGRKAQRERWLLRRQEKRLTGVRLREQKGSKRGAQKGAFGRKKWEFV